MRKSPIPWLSSTWLRVDRSLKCHHSEARGVSSASVQYRWSPRAGSLEAMAWVISALFQAVVELMVTGAV